MNTRIALATAALALALCAAPTAAADNQSYLDAVSPVTVYKPAGLLMAGKDACRLLGPRPGYMFGLVATKVADQVWSDWPLLERDQAALVVNAAIDNLCPGTNVFGQRA